MEEPHPLRILFVEDVPADAELAERAIRKEGLVLRSVRVETEAAFLKALEEFKPDVIVSDYSLPGFNGMQALKLSLERDPLLPFILFTGSMNEETAVACMKAGATDYVLKDRLSRLPFAVGEALEQNKLRSARSEAERALRESEERFCKVFEEGPMGLVMTAPSSGRFIRANASFIRMVEYTEEELKLLTFVDITHPDHRSRDVQAIKKLWDGQIPLYQTEKRYLKKSGETVWATLKASVIRGEDGKPIYSLAMIEDITARKWMETALRKASMQLSRAEEEERRRIARELHDSTGQKLAALSMIVGMLQDGANAPAGKTRKMFADCQAMIEKCAQEIRTLSYLLHPPLLDELGLAAAIGDYVEGFAKRSGMEATFDASPDLGQLPKEVDLALFRVAQESLTNIHRHAGASTAHIQLNFDAEQVTLEVRDDGCGMSTEKMHALVAGHGVLGVGIKGMQERLRLLDGRLEIHSGGQGTTVRAIIPRREEPT